MNGSRLPHDRKGREGNRKGSGKENTEFSTHPQSVPASLANECARSARRILVGLILVLGLTACSGVDNQQREDRRYRECLASGGSWSTHDVDYACTRPEVTR